MLSNCLTAVKDGRYTWRHNSILYTMSHYCAQLGKYRYDMYVDLDGFDNPSKLFKSSRPDLALVKNDEVTIIELTCCFETNALKSRSYKIDKDKSLQSDISNRYKIKRKIFVEVTTLGFTMKHINGYKRLFYKTDIDVERMIRKMSEVSARCSYFIYTQRNKSWTNKDILLFY